MDDKRFDDLSRRLAVPLTRAGFFKSLSAVGGAALAGITGLNLAEAKKGKGGDKKGKKGKKGHGKKGNQKKGNGGQQHNQSSSKDSRVSPQAQPTCASQGKTPICHCPPGNPNNCKVICVGSPSVACEEAHGDHAGDCACSGTIDCTPPEDDIPGCGSGACGAGPSQGDQCTPICAGECNEEVPCPSLGGTCECVSGTCQTVQTCDPACGTCTTCNETTDQCDFVGDGNLGPGCQAPDECCDEGGGIDCCTGAEVCTTGIGCCIPDGELAPNAEACCSDTYCEDTGRCGVCPTCDPACGTCTTCNETTDQCDFVGDGNPGPGCEGECCDEGNTGIDCCTGLEVCGSGKGCCIPDNLPAGSAAECCGPNFCPNAEGPGGVCAECPPVECAGGCQNQQTCTALGANCVCHTLAQEPFCGACIPDGQPAGSDAECCSGDFCPGSGICGLCPPAPTPPTPAQLATCPPGYTGNAKSPCNGTCPCSKGRTCKNGRCCEKKGTHCGTGKECCSGKCKRTHDNHKQCG